MKKQFIARICIFLIMIIGVSACNNKEYHYEWRKKGKGREIACKMTTYSDTAGHKYFGKVSECFPSGKPYATYYVENGYKTIELNSYYENGQLCAATAMSYDEPDGFHAEYYRNGKIRVYALYTDSVPIYAISFDTSGRMKKIFWNYYLMAPNEIKLGQEIEIRVQVPLIKGFDTITDFFVGVLPQNIYGTDSLNKYKILSQVQQKKWVHSMDTTGNFDSLKQIKMQDIPINNQGVAVFDYRPKSPGEYHFKGSVEVIIEKTQKDSTYYSMPLDIKFSVTK